MTDVLGDVLARRRDRAIAAVLGLKEREVDPHLPADVARRLRKAVLDQFNDYYGLTMDVLESLVEAPGAPVLNDHWLNKIGDIHDAVVVTNGNAAPRS